MLVNLKRALQYFVTKYVNIYSDFRLTLIFKKIFTMFSEITNNKKYLDYIFF